MSIWDAKTKEFDDDEVECPYCGHVQDMTESYDLITYFGDKGEELKGCQSCDRKFRIQEIVKRSYVVAEEF